LGCQNTKTGYLEFTEIIAKILTKDSFWKCPFLDFLWLKKQGFLSVRKIMFLLILFLIPKDV